MGLDWDKIRADYEAKATPEELGTKLKPKPRRTVGTGLARAVYDQERILALYTAGRTVAQIVEEVGCHRQTVYNTVRSRGLEVRDDRKNNPGPPKREKCSRDHEYTEENTRIDIRGNRHCRACEAIWAQRRRDRKVQGAFN